MIPALGKRSRPSLGSEENLRKQKLVKIYLKVWTMIQLQKTTEHGSFNNMALALEFG